VNTVIVLLQRPKAGEPCWEDAARFVAYKKPFEDYNTSVGFYLFEEGEDGVYCYFPYSIHQRYTIDEVIDAICKEMLAHK
jgi:hypothetical protein